MAAKDYWESGVKAYLAQNVFRAVLVQRGAAAQAVSEEQARAAGRATIEQLAEALGETDSLNSFPWGRAEWENPSLRSEADSSILRNADQMPSWCLRIWKT